MNEHKIEGYEHGADAYLTKPFQSELLLARINNLLRSRLQLKDLWSTREQPHNQTVTTQDAPDISNENAVENRFITRFKDVVSENLSNSDLSVEDLAGKMGLSRVQLYRKVKAITGTTPVELLRSARLSRAQELLHSTDLTMSEIAYQVGFASPAYFNKCYKEAFGTSPGETRKNNA